MESRALQNIGEMLEQYTLLHPQEVLLVIAQIQDVRDEILIFKGFSSSLVQSTAFDPELPMLPPTAQIICIRRLQAPFQAQNPQYLGAEMSWQEFQIYLKN